MPKSEVTPDTMKCWFDWPLPFSQWGRLITDYTAATPPGEDGWHFNRANMEICCEKRQNPFGIFGTWFKTSLEYYRCLFTLPLLHALCSTHCLIPHKYKPCSHWLYKKKRAFKLLQIFSVRKVIKIVVLSKHYRAWITLMWPHKSY
jgi:hypothetical protein